MTAARTITVLAAALTLTAAVALPARFILRQPASSTLQGTEVAVGKGMARMFVERGPRGEPRTVGVALTEAALNGLATHMNTTSRCFDKNGDGKVSHGECLGDYQAILALPDGAADLGLPVRWATVNWNPEGHLAPAPPVWRGSGAGGPEARLLAHLHLWHVRREADLS